MKLKVNNSQINGEITVPGSKSHTIRAVAVASLADGTSIIRDPLISEDAISSINAATQLGAEIDKQPKIWTVKGNGGNLQKPNTILDVGNSGTTLRIFTGLAATADFEVKFDGDASLRSRPMHSVLDALTRLGVKAISTDGKCPLSVKGPLLGGKTEVDGTSSQFLTSLLFAAPLATEDTIITVHNLNEKPYVEITMDWLSKQGILFEYNSDYTEFKIKGNQKYKPFDLAIPADFSTATFPLLAAALTKGTVKINNLDFNDRQGDKAVFDYFKEMGMKIDKYDDYTMVAPGSRFSGIEIDLNATPDALPAMAVAGAVAEGQMVLKNVAQARIKETDRIACMTSELRKMGIDVTEREDGMVINGGTLKGAEVEGHDDHRIVMALALAGLVAEGETIVNGAEAASVTYPDFIEDFKALGAAFETV